MSAWPGQKFNIQLTAWDEFRTQTSASGRYDFRHYTVSHSLLVQAVMCIKAMNAWHLICTVWASQLIICMKMSELCE